MAASGVTLSGTTTTIADAARYGLASGARFVSPDVAPGFSPAFGRGIGNIEDATLKGGATQPQFVHGMPLGEQIARQVNATDPTSRAIHFQRLENEANKFFKPTSACAADSAPK